MLELKNQTISSREIAEITGKRHDNILRDCEKLNESYLELSLLKIEEGIYTHQKTGSQEHKQMLLNKMQCMDLMTGYNVELRIKVNRRWEELENEKQTQLPQTYLEALKCLIIKEEELLEKNNKLIEQEPKVKFSEAVEVSDSVISIGCLAKLIEQKCILKIGQNRLFEWLRDNNYLQKGGEDKNTPLQKYIEQGLFVIKLGTRLDSNGDSKITTTPKVTGKGQIYFINKFLKAKADYQNIIC